MNLLFLINIYPSHGGTEMVTTVLANAFAKKGHSVSIVSFEQPLPELADQLDKNVRFHALAHPMKNSQAKFRQILIDEETDFIINQWCLPYFVTRFCRSAMRGTSCKLLAVHHNAPNQNSLLNHVKIQISQSKSLIHRIYFRLKLWGLKAITIASLRYVYHFSDRYVVLSESFVELFRRFTGLQSVAKVAVIGNPLTLAKPNSGSTNPSKEKLIIYVGRVDYNQKRVERIVRVWEQLAQRIPDWRLEIVGDGPERERLEAIAIENRIPRISFEGFQNPIEYYERASILLLTSEYEGFGLVIVEAMAFGCVPIVYGSYTAVYDIITNGEDGVIVPAPYDRAVFAEEIEKIANDSDRRQTMADAGLERAKKFDVLDAVEKWERLFARA